MDELALDDPEGVLGAENEPVFPPRSNRRFPAEFCRDTGKWRHPIETSSGS